MTLELNRIPSGNVPTHCDLRKQVAGLPCVLPVLCEVCSGRFRRHGFMAPWVNGMRHYVPSQLKTQQPDSVAPGTPPHCGGDNVCPAHSGDAKSSVRRLHGHTEPT